MTMTVLVLLVLASFRLTHLLVFDTIAEPFRDLMNRYAWTGALISCYWCCGIWVSGLLVVWSYWSPDTALPVCVFLAVAGGQALLESVVQRK